MRLRAVRYGSGSRNVPDERSYDDGGRCVSASRRFVLKVLATLRALAAGAAARAAPEPRAVTLTAAVTRQQIVPDDYPQSEVWSFNRAVAVGFLVL